MTELHNQLQGILERTREISKELAQARCSNAVCGLSKVLVEVVEDPKTSGVLTLHAVACSQNSDCYFAQNPLEITEVVREAAGQVQEELHLGSCDAPKHEQGSQIT